jgi:uncharacterized alpha-E superfamily protein
MDRKADVVCVAKATDETLTSENWEYIMEVVDKVQLEESGGKDVVASMIKRLAHRNANVQLYTLEVCLHIYICILQSSTTAIERAEILTR